MELWLPCTCADMYMYICAHTYGDKGKYSEAKRTGREVTAEELRSSGAWPGRASLMGKHRNQTPSSLSKSGMTLYVWWLVHAYNSSVQEAEVGGLRIQNQPELNKQTLKKKKAKG